MKRLAQVALAIGQRLKTARLAARLTLAEVAKRAALSEGFLSRLERGEVSASIANLVQLADVLGLHLGELFGAAAGAQGPTRVAAYRSGDATLREIPATGYRRRVLAGGAPLDRMEVFHLVFPHTSRMTTLVSHSGRAECARSCPRPTPDCAPPGALRDHERAECAVR